MSSSLTELPELAESTLQKRIAQTISDIVGIALSFIAFAIVFFTMVINLA